MYNYTIILIVNIKRHIAEREREREREREERERKRETEQHAKLKLYLNPCIFLKQESNEHIQEVYATCTVEFH